MKISLTREKPEATKTSFGRLLAYAQTTRQGEGRPQYGREALEPDIRSTRRQAFPVENVEAHGAA